MKSNPAQAVPTVATTFDASDLFKVQAAGCFDMLTLPLVLLKLVRRAEVFTGTVVPAEQAILWRKSNSPEALRFRCATLTLMFIQLFNLAHRRARRA